MGRERSLPGKYQPAWGARACLRSDTSDLHRHGGFGRRFRKRYFDHHQCGLGFDRRDPRNPSIPLGTLQQFTATGTFSDATTQDISNTVTWSSSNTNVASITVSGLATARNLGATTIVATSGPVSGSVSATVDASDISSLAVAPASPTIAQITSQQFSAVGTFNDGSTHDLTNQVTWTSSDTAVAAIGKTNGIAKGLTAGTATISAAVGALSASADLTVTNATVTSIAVPPTARTI